MPQAQPSMREIFSQALEIESDDDRQAFLDEVCRGDAALRRRVEELLRAHLAAGEFLNARGSVVATVDVPATTECSGTRIGPYTLREQIGEGGFGVVCVAEQTEPVARTVALKIVKPGMDTKEVIARFEAERQALALMDHPNVARVYDAGVTESGRPYFVMELVHGIPITEFCDEQSLSNRERLRLFIDVCRAVQHAHQKGIIHRDLKPSNIMVTMHDDQPVPKVIDFGVAKALSRKLTEKTVYTSYGQMVGTPMYMSPEQAQMSGLDLDTRSDIYSLGVLLYELLTGTTPFDKETIQNAGYDELRRIIREDDPPRPSARVSTLNAELLSTASGRRNIDGRRLSQSLRGELDWIVMKALEKNRGRRYETASQLAEDIGHYLNDEPVAACPPSLGYRFRKFARRNRVALTTSCLVAIALIAGTIVSVSQAVRASAAEMEADRQRRAAEQVAKRAQESEHIARSERDAAVAAREKLRRVLYASEMNLIQSAWEHRNYRRVIQLLDQTRPGAGESDIRGFEWHYWNGLMNGSLETRSVSMPQDETRRLLEETLSPDGTRLAVQYFKEGQVSVAIWDVATTREICNFALAAGSLNTARTIDQVPRTAMTFSPDGTRIATVASRTGNLRIWDTRTGKQLFQVEEDGVIHHAFLSRDGNRVIYTLAKPQNRQPSDIGYKVWDLSTNKMLFSHQYSGKTYPYLFLTGRDGMRLVLRKRSDSGPGRHLQIWDVETASVLQDRAFDGAFRLLASSPDGERIVLQARWAPGQLLVLETESMKIIDFLVADGLFESSKATISPDGRLLAASTDAGKVYVWNLKANARKHPADLEWPILHVADSLVELRFSADSRELLCCVRSRVWSWRMPRDWESLKRRTWGQGGILGGSFNSDGTRAILRAQPVGVMNQATLLLKWDVDSDREIWRYQDSRGNRSLSTPVLSPDERYVVVPSRKVQLDRSQAPTALYNELHVLAGDTGRLLRTFKPEQAMNIDNMVFRPGSSVVAFIVTRQPAGAAPSFELVEWNVETGAKLVATKLNDGNPGLVGFSGDGRELMVAQPINGGVLILDADTGAARRVIAPEGTYLRTGFGKWSVSPDGRTLAVFGRVGHENDVAVTFFDAASGERRLRMPVDTEHPPLAMKWSPDGRRLALISSQGFDTEVTLWDTKTGRLVLTLNCEGIANPNHRSICFSPEGRRLLHIPKDNRVEAGQEDDNPSLHPIHVWDATPLEGSNEGRDGSVPLNHRRE